MKNVKKIRKGILSFFLTLVLVAGMMSGIVSGTSMVAKADGTHTHDGITFTEWTSTNSLPTSAGNYYLANDVTISSTWSVPSGTTNLCLNGHGITMTGSARVITIGSGKTLNLYDCDTSTTHHYTISDPAPNGAGLAVVNSSGDKAFTGGYITGGVTNSGSNNGSGAGILNKGNLNMYGGTIIGNQETAGGSSGGGIAGLGGCIKIYGGSVIGNSAVSAGGLYIAQSQTCYIYGGEFKFNKAGDVGCANIQNTQILGGVFTNNYETGGYGVIISTATYGGNVIIKNNYTGEKEKNLCRESNGLKIVEQLTNTDPIGVSWKGSIGTGKVFTSSENTDYNDPTKFKSDDSAYTVIKNTDGQLELVPLCSVTYNGNGNTGGSVPTDANSPYAYGSTVTVRGNTGSLVKSGYTFDGWNTEANGTGTTYAANATFTINADTTLYAKWTAIPATSPTINSVSSLTGDNALTYGYTSGSVSVSATPATGHTITGYQWYSNTTNSNTGGSIINGATSSSYSIPSGKNAGTYYYYCVVTTTRTDNSQTATATSNAAAVNIDKKAVTVTADNQSVSLNGNIDSSVGKATLGGALEGHTLHSVTLTPSSTANITTNGTITPSNATIYSGTNDVTDNYEINYASGVLTVTSVPASVTTLPSANNRTYDKTEQPLLNNNGVAVGGTLYYALGSNDTDEPEDSAFSTSIPTAAHVGTYYVWYKAVKINDNYTDSVAVCVPVTIGQRPITVSGITANDKTYDGTDTASLDYSAIDWTACGLVEGDELGVTATGTFVDSNVSVNDSGEAIAKTVNITNLSLGGADVANYKLADTGNQAVTTAIISRKAATVTAKNQTVALAGSITDGVIMAELSGALEGHELTAVTLTSSSTANATTSGTITPSAATINNGNTDVTANYDITYVNGVLTVDRAATGVTTPPAAKTGLVYNGGAQELVTPGEGVSGGTLYYAVTLTDEEPEDSEYSTEIPKEKNSGVYYVWYKIVADEDHIDSDVSHFTVAIDKKEITISGITALDKTYDTTNEVTLNLDNVIYGGIVEGDVLTATATGAFEDENAGEDKNVDINIISLGGTDIDNYRLAQDGQQTSTTASIKKKAVTVTALEQMIVIDGSIDTSLDMAVLEGAMEGHELAEVILTSGSTESVTAEGVITPSDAKIVSGDIDVTDNYEITYINGVMTVTKADSEVILDKTSVGEDTSITTVESPNLQEFAEKAAEDRKLVKVELSVKLVAEEELEADTVSSIKEAAETLFTNVNKDTLKLEYLEIDMTKYVDGVKDGLIGDTTTPIEIVVTYDTSKAGNPVIIRRHGGNVSVFTLLSAKPTSDYKDATYYIDGNKIYIYSQYFSDFAIVYSVEKTFNVNLDNGMGDITRIIATEGAKYIPPTNLTRDGYAFDGWYKDDTYKEKWNPDTDTVTADTKLFAKWTKKTEPVNVDVPETKVETPETNVETQKSDTPKTETTKKDNNTLTTGDKMHIGIIVLLMLDSAMAGLYLTLRRKMIK